MKSGTRTTSKSPILLLVALFLALAPAALAKNTWYVDGVNGNDSNDCKSPQTACKTIGQAISLAKGSDSIMVAPAIYTENFTIGISLKIIGSDSATTIVDGGGVSTVVTISSPKVHVILSKLTIQNGFSSTQEGGGGISNYGVLKINNSTISGNTALRRAGGIFNFGILSLNNSTISGNSSSYGGGIVNFDVLTINNSTLNGNSASVTGGGILNDSGTATLQNTIVVNSPSGGNCSGTMTSHGYNLSSDNTCNFNNSGDLNYTDPVLGTLGNHGGPTQTMVLLKGSPAIDAGNPNGCTDDKGNLLKRDQRGWPRPGKEDTGGCDMGAVERQKD